MAKKIIDESGNTYVEKKPFYKRIWFIILMVVIVIGGLSSLGKKGTAASTDRGADSLDNDTSEENAEVKSNEEVSYGMGQLYCRFKQVSGVQKKK